jgi:cyclic pyranopterin phosphate synthase
MKVELVSSPAVEPMVDPFGRHVTYLRVSVTDRCDFRCVYCMSEHMTFLPKKDLLTLEELDRLCSVFIARGVKKIRIAGGEPLVRKNIIWLFHALSRPLRSGALDELTLTTNGSQLPKFAEELKGLGVRRINISLDTLVMAGIEAAERVGLKIKLNAVALKGVNEDEYDDLIRFAHGRGIDLMLIETMPMGEIDGDRTDQYLPLSIVRARLME